MDEHRRAEITRVARNALIRAYRPDSGVWESPERATRELLPIPVERIAMKTFACKVSLVQALPSNTPDVETWATFDFSQNHISVLESLRLPLRNFTIAHELGHLLLHRKRLPRVFRERVALGVSSTRRARFPMEEEADWFAVTLTMPEPLIRGEFQQRFHVPIALQEVDEHVAYWLEAGTGRALSPSFLRSEGKEHLAYLLSIAASFAGKQFTPLAKVFGVSPTAMAFRLRELRLVT